MKLKQIVLALSLIGLSAGAAHAAEVDLSEHDVNDKTPALLCALDKMTVSESNVWYTKGDSTEEATIHDKGHFSHVSVLCEGDLSFVEINAHQVTGDVANGKTIVHYRRTNADGHSVYKTSVVEYTPTGNKVLKVVFFGDDGKKI